MMPTTAVSRPIWVGLHWIESSASTLKLLTKKPNGSASRTEADHQAAQLLAAEGAP